MRGRHRASVAKALQQSMLSIRQEALSVDWLKVFRASFMLLFVAYPGAGLRLLSVFCDIMPRQVVEVCLRSLVCRSRRCRRGTEDHALVPMRNH